MSCTENTRDHFHSEAAFLANYYTGKLLDYKTTGNKPKTVVLYGVLQPCDKCQEKLKTASSQPDFLKGVPIRYLIISLASLLTQEQCVPLLIFLVNLSVTSFNYDLV